MGALKRGGLEPSYELSIQKYLFAFTKVISWPVTQLTCVQLENRSTLNAACKVVSLYDIIFIIFNRVNMFIFRVCYNLTQINQTPRLHVILPQCTAYLFCTQTISTKMTLHVGYDLIFFNTNCEKKCND